MDLPYYPPSSAIMTWNVVHWRGTRILKFNFSYNVTVKVLYITYQFFFMFWYAYIVRLCNFWKNIVDCCKQHVRWWHWGNTWWKSLCLMKLQFKGLFTILCVCVCGFWGGVTAWRMIQRLSILRERLKYELPATRISWQTSFETNYIQNFI